MAAVRQMRQFSQRPGLHDAVAAGDLSRSWADAIARWTRKLPEGMRDETDKILLEAAAAGASLQDLATIAAAAIERWRSTRPDPDDDFDFRDRHVRLGQTFGGAGVIRGDLTPECAAAVTAVLEALGKKQGPEDDRSQGQRFHDALAEACHLLLRARLVPDRAGADTQVIVHVPISQLRQMPGAAGLEDAWLRARLGEPADPGTAYLAGQDAEAAACDALTVPVVTGHADMTVIDKIIALAKPARHPARPEDNPLPAGTASDGTASDGTARTVAWQAHRYAIARLALDFVSGPGGLASALRTGLLEHPYSTPSLPLDIGYSRLDPGPHPPRRHAPRPALLLARRLRPPRLRLRRPPHHATRATAARPRSTTSGSSANSTTNLHPPLGLDDHPPPRRHHGSPQPRRQTDPQKPRPAKPARGLG